MSEQRCVARQLPLRMHIGTQRAGSSFLNNLLKNHPQVVLSFRQEPSYYSWGYRHGLSWYLDSFPGEGVPVDTSPSYFTWPGAPERINQALGDQQPKFSLILRHPVDYLRSNFLMSLRSGKLKRRYPDATGDLREFARRHPEYLEQGLYGKHLADRWLTLFPRESFHIVLFEDFTRHTERCTAELLSFWGLEAATLATVSSSQNKTLRFPFLYKLKKWVVKDQTIKRLIKKNPLFNLVYERILTERKAPLPAEDRQYLLDFFAEDIQNLSAIAGPSVLRWLDQK